MTEAITTIYTQNAYTSESDDDSEEQLNISKIEYNQFLLDGMGAFNKRDFINAIKYYEGALKIALSSKDIDKLCSTKWYNYFLTLFIDFSNLAIIYFYSNDFSRSLLMLDECARTLRDLQNNNILSDNQMALFVRILVIIILS